MAGVVNRFRVLLDSAFTNKRFSAAGNKIEIAAASSTDALVQVAMQNNSISNFLDMQLDYYQADVNGFDQFYVSNQTAQAGEWVDLIVTGVNDFEYVRRKGDTINAIAAAVTTKGGGSRTHTAPTVGLVAGLVLAANPDRTSWVFKNNGTVTVYLGSTSGVTTANGMPVPPGAIVGDTDGADLYAISGTAGQDCRVWETE